MRITLGTQEDFWARSSPHNEDDAIDPEAAIERCRSAIDALEIAASTHPVGPTILLMRGKKASYRDIGEYVHMTHSNVRKTHQNIVQAVRAQHV